MTKFNCKIKATYIGVMLAAGILSSMTSLSTMANEYTTETSKYLIIATGKGEYGDNFNSGGGEYGAQQEVVSSDNSGDGPSGDQEHYSFQSSGTNIHSDFVTSGRWVENGSANNTDEADYLPGAKNMSEKPDYSGNIAITDETGKFNTSNTDYFADIGIVCENIDDKDECGHSLSSNNSWIESGTNDKELSKNDNNSQGGIVNFDDGDRLALLKELDDWRDTIDNLKADATWTYDSSNKWKMNDVDGNKIDIGSGLIVTEFDAIDTGDDDYIVIDINGKKGSNRTDFNLSNSDWILKNSSDKLIIFRMTGESKYIFGNSSIMMGCSNDIPGRCTDDDIDELGAIFYTSDKYSTFDHDSDTVNNENAYSNDTFDLSDVILGGVGLWDLDSQQNTGIVTDNIQGCTQFISSQVTLSSKTRLARCTVASTTTEIPEPSTLVLFAFALFGLHRYRGKTL